MKNKGILVIVCLIVSATFLFPASNPWGNLKKIHFYDSLNNYEKVLEHLQQIDTKGLRKQEKTNLGQQLITFGDHYLSKKQYKTAESFYTKVISFSPGYWHLYNKLEKIEHEQGSSFISFSNAFKQLAVLLKDFKSSFIFVNHFLNMLFFASLFMFLLFSMVMFYKYFKLAGHDLLFKENGSLSFPMLLLLLGLLLWPLIMLSGWMIYPFLISGFLWVYINENEKKAIIYLLILVGIMSLVYSFNIRMERTIKTNRFNIIQQVYNGKLFEREVYEKFDNPLKVAQAFSYYETRQYDTALEILASTGSHYVNRFKYELMANIYYKSENFDESINYYDQAMRLDDSNQVTLNNFTLALLKNDDQDTFKENSRRYPAIDDYMKTVSTFIEPEISPTSFLWRRLVSDSDQKFEFGAFITRLLGEFFVFPVFFFILGFVLYIFGLKKVLPILGGSTYCSKCSKIIKEATVHRSYKLCEECYQLFSIKDVIFLEAKILKEKELTKRFRKKYIAALLFSVLIPGINLNIKEKNRTFVLLSLFFYFLLGFAVIGSMVFTGIFNTSPVILNLVGMLALIYYFIINLFSIMGDYDGF